MRVKWLDSAIESLDAQGEHIARDDPDAAVRIVNLIFDRVERLAAFPASGRPGRIPGTRELVVSATPFIVAYRVTGQSVEVLRVLHAAQKLAPRVLTRQAGAGTLSRRRRYPRRHASNLQPKARVTAPGAAPLTFRGLR